MASLELLLGLVRSSLRMPQKVELLKKLDNLRALTVLSIDDIRQLTGSPVRRSEWLPSDIEAVVERDLSLMERYSIGTVGYLSSWYPPLLREIPDPPFALFYRGTLPDPEKPLIGVVGTRSPSGDGALAAARFGAELAQAGVAVVSGLARGIDALAHRGNVDGGAPSVAVLACGPDRLYPRSNQRLAGALLARGGCVISEYPPGEAPLKYRFPQRNRIIAGLSRALLVVEAPERSGALITADFALEQGRDVFVCTVALSSRRGAGTAVLHRQGAQAVSGASELLAALERPRNRVDVGSYAGIGQNQLLLDLSDSAGAGSCFGRLLNPESIESKPMESLPSSQQDSEVRVPRSYAYGGKKAGSKEETRGKDPRYRGVPGKGKNNREISRFGICGKSVHGASDRLAEVPHSHKYR